MLDRAQNSKRSGMTGPQGIEACLWLATSPQRASWKTLPADAERVFGDLASWERRAASPGQELAGTDASSTALRSADRAACLHHAFHTGALRGIAGPRNENLYF